MLRNYKLSSTVVVGLIVALTLSACADAGAPQAEPTSSSSSSTTTNQREQPTLSATPVPPSATPTPTIKPATGQLITISLKNLKRSTVFRIPAGTEWYITGDKTSIVIISSKDVPPGADRFLHMEMTMFPQIGDDLSHMAQTSLKVEQRDYKFPLKITGYRTINGVKGFVLQGTGPDKQFYLWGGLDADNILTEFIFKIPKGLKLSDWVEPVLASIQWK